jgi:hypothetical protein
MTSQPYSVRRILADPVARRDLIAEVAKRS